MRAQARAAYASACDDVKERLFAVGAPRKPMDDNDEYPAAFGNCASRLRAVQLELCCQITLRDSGLTGCEEAPEGPGQCAGGPRYVTRFDWVR